MRSGNDWAFAAVLIGVIAVGLVATRRNDEPAPDGRATAIVAPADVLARYRANEARAQGDFDAVRISSTGTVSELRLNVSGDPVVKIETGDPAAPLTVHFIDDDQARAQGMERGGSVTVICGKAAFLLGMPVLLDCGIVAGG